MTVNSGCYILFKPIAVFERHGESDPISRASRTMAECVASRQHLMAAE